MNNEIKKIIQKAKSAQEKIQKVVQSQDWLDEAKKYAEKQRQEVRKLLHTDTLKLKGFLEKQRKELESLQNRLPGEMKKLRDFVQIQRKEFEKLIANVRKVNKKQKTTKKKSTRKSTT